MVSRKNIYQVSIDGKYFDFNLIHIREKVNEYLSKDAHHKEKYEKNFIVISSHTRWEEIFISKQKIILDIPLIEKSKVEKDASLKANVTIDVPSRAVICVYFSQP